MRRLPGWQVALGVSLVALSAVLYSLHYTIFRDSHHIFIYMLGDIAFVPVEVLLVTLIIHKLLSIREKKSLMNKLNMVIGAFFSEVGYQLIKDLLAITENKSELQKGISLKTDWTPKDFEKARKHVVCFEASFSLKDRHLDSLKDSLVSKRDFLLRLLENPNLLEHESFTNLLWSVFHLTEELTARQDLGGLPGPDYEHLGGDIKRVYGYLICEWLLYMGHLKAAYPFLFSLAVRTSPFNPAASAVIRK
jgi:hypothetical protein